MKKQTGERLNKIEKRTNEIELLKQQMEQMQQESASTKAILERTEKELDTAKEEKKKGFFTCLFGK